MYPAQRACKHPAIRITISILAVLLLLPARAIGSDPEELFRLADEAKSEGRYLDSLDLTVQLYRQTGAVELLNNIGWLQAQLGRFQQAYQTYRRLVEDKSAPEELRSLDRERMKELEPRLKHAWLTFDDVPKDLKILLNGGHFIPSAGETRMLPRRHMIETRRERSPDLMIRSRQLEAGLRTSWNDILLPRPEADGTIDLYGLLVTEIEIDGYIVVANLEKIRRIFVDAGRHSITISFTDRPKANLRLDIAPGETILLETKFSGRGTPDPKIEIVLPPPKVEEGPTVIPWVIAGTGVVVGIVSVVLYASAQSDRSTVEDAGRNEAGAIAGITQVEALDLESSANSKATVSLGLAITGGVLVAAGTALGLL